MDGYDKTKGHERTWLPIGALYENPNNPNEMTPREFDLLVKNIQDKGVTEDIEVRPLGDNKYRIIGGHHRFKACKYLGWDEAPCIINNDPDMDDERETFQVIKMNTIRGKMSPDKFMKLYDQLSVKYSDELLQEMMGFASDEEFQKLIKQTGNNLPPELKDKFFEASKDVKTVEQLAKVLNNILSEKSNTLGHGYLIFDFEGRESIWIRMLAKQRTPFMALANWCHDNERAVDDVMHALVKLIAQEEVADQVRTKTSQIDFTLPNHVIPTKDLIEGS